MYYFFHGTTVTAFKNILKDGYIYASKYLNQEQIRMISNSKFIFTNIYIDGLPLQSDEKMGLGEVTLLIDPIILKYKKCYVNFGWLSNIKDAIVFNDTTEEYILNKIKNNYQYPYILTHEALFKKRISMDFVIGIICSKQIESSIKKYLSKYGYTHLRIFHHFPTLLK